MDKREELVESVIRRAKESKGRKTITCAEAFELAKEFGAKVIEIGRICNQHNVRISKCQLGCFM